MKKNLIKYFVSGFALFALAACSADDVPSPDEVSGNDFAVVRDGKVIVNVGVDAPDPAAVGTRALDGTPDYNDMHLFMVEFDDNGGPLQNTYITTYRPTSETPSTDRVNYKFELNATSRSRILHLIAVPKSVESLGIDYGIEASVIPNLKTDNQTPAYWRRLVFENGYAYEENGKMVYSSDLEQLKHVALVRNFAQVTVTNNASNFELTGFTIVNNPASGTIAPWNTKDYTFPNYLDGSQAQIGYPTLSGSYSGTVPAGLTFTNQEDLSVTMPDGSDAVAPKYLYERPFNSIRHTYVILRGHRKVNGTDEADTYYKLDIGKNDANGIFRYFSILRNFSYDISLKSVAQKGYASIQEAIDGVVYNNFSFDINLTSMLNISDGQDIIFVNFTTAVLTDDKEQTIDFKYRYRNITSSDGTYNNDAATFINLAPGDVIKSVSYGKDGADGWRNVKLTCNPAVTETKTQSFVIINKATGLGRTINLILHRKWTLGNVVEYRGALNQYGAAADKGVVGTGVGAQFTTFFDIPDNMEEAMFPLVFTIEADTQNIENNPSDAGTLVVTSGESLFGGVTGVNRIQYLKTVTWTQYNEEYEAKTGNNGTMINNGNGTYTHRVRCRMRTTSSGTGKITVRIANPNFNVTDVAIQRAN